MHTNGDYYLLHSKQRPSHALPPYFSSLRSLLPFCLFISNCVFFFTFSLPLLFCLFICPLSHIFLSSTLIHLRTTLKMNIPNSENQSRHVLDSGFTNNADRSASSFFYAKQRSPAFNSTKPSASLPTGSIPYQANTSVAPPSATNGFSPITATFQEKHLT